MRFITAVLLLIFWPGVLMTPAQNVMFRSQNYAPAASGGAQALVHAAGFTCVISGESCSQTLGWTVTPGDFLFVAAQSRSVTIAGVTASGSAMVGNTDNTLSVLPNAPAATQVTINYSSSNGAQAAFVVMEFSGMSATAALQGTAITGSTTNGTLNSWSSGSTYTNPTSGSLVISCSMVWNTTSVITSMGVGGSWVLGAYAVYSSSPSTNLLCEYQVAAATGTYVDSGTSLPTGNNGTVYIRTAGYK